VPDFVHPAARAILLELAQRVFFTVESVEEPLWSVRGLRYARRAARPGRANAIPYAAPAGRHHGTRPPLSVSRFSNQR
jgi:hypothetical protein